MCLPNVLSNKSLASDPQFYLNHEILTHVHCCLKILQLALKYLERSPLKMKQVIAIFLGMLGTILLVDGAEVPIAKSQTWTWSHEIPDGGMSVRATIRSGGSATVFVSYSGPATVDDFDELYFLVEGLQTAMYFPKKSDTVNVLVRANDDSDVLMEAYWKAGELIDCDFNFCAENEKCWPFFGAGLVCSAE
ncbi:hypothetical protein HELRODRAFT_174011 [Helobdella robusta]|uniref:Uncharacterized protein n=1 Tax=Helobdella robusta TaxID=6412 RepID=T1F7H2_HELRO|nr:hypothetical protein HELRODRAFT_174011 [Helobdella robusta]ESO03122.1 hypothetical protein HELRODRAFT_174011 [Helobdella robusta]